MPDNAATEKEKHMKQLKRRMECWREVILPVNSILLWEKWWHPTLIVGITSTIVLLICYQQPTLLTMIAVCLLIVALVDYFAPIVASTFFSSGAWNGQKERKLEEICQSLSGMILQIQSWLMFLLNVRNTRPSLYYGCITPSLILLAWFGNTVNNLLFFYLAANAVLLTPGFRHKGRARAAINYAYHYLVHRKSS